MYIGKTGNNKIVIAGAKNIGTNIPAAYDPATCYNVDIYDNKPEIVQRGTRYYLGRMGHLQALLPRHLIKKATQYFLKKRFKYRLSTMQETPYLLSHTQQKTTLLLTL